MAFAFDDLDAHTSTLMLNEIDLDVGNDALYKGDRLTDVGSGSWETLLQDACRTGDDVTLAAARVVPGGTYLCATEPNPRSPAGEPQAVPSNAAATMADGEFNRFYIRALCVRAIDDSVDREIYRARPSARPDPQSEALIGQTPDAAALVADLRTNIGVATALSLPPHPNSGLSVRLKS